MVIGIEKAIPVLQNIYDKADQFQIEDRYHTVFEKQITIKKEE